MASALYTDIKRKEGQSVFIRPHEGLFGLREWIEQGVAFQASAGAAPSGHSSAGCRAAAPPACALRAGVLDSLPRRLPTLAPCCPCPCSCSCLAAGLPLRWPTLAMPAGLLLWLPQDEFAEEMAKRARAAFGVYGVPGGPSCGSSAPAQLGLHVLHAVSPLRTRVQPEPAACGPAWCCHMRSAGSWLSACPAGPLSPQQACLLCCPPWWMPRATPSLHPTRCSPLAVRAPLLRCIPSSPPRPTHTSHALPWRSPSGPSAACVRMLARTSLIFQLIFEEPAPARVLARPMLAHQLARRQQSQTRPLLGLPPRRHAPHAGHGCAAVGCAARSGARGCCCRHGDGRQGGPRRFARWPYGASVGGRGAS